MLRRYNPEHNEYTHYVPLEEAKEIEAKLIALKERLKDVPVFNPSTKEMHEDTVEFDINDISTIKEYIANAEHFNIDAPINNRHASLLLVACYFCNNKEVIEYLVENGSSVNKTDVFGYNPLMSIIMNDYMETDIKIDCLNYLIDKGCDINWLNILAETPLTIAIARFEIDIAHLLLDRGAILYTIPQS